MMESVIDGLFNGGITAFGRKVTPNPQRMQVNRELEKQRSYFLQTLSEQDCQRLEDLNNLYAKAGLIEEQDSFSYGLQLGILLMCEVFESGKLNTEI